MFNWIHQLFASEQPILEKFTIVDPSAVGEKVRSVTLALTPGIDDSPSSVVSLYWTDSDIKIYERQFQDMQTAHGIFDSMKHDLNEASDLTKVEKLPEAAALVSSLLKRYDVHTDNLIDGNPEPVTTTQASVKVASDAENPSDAEFGVGFEEKGNPLSPEDQVDQDVENSIGSPTWINTVLENLQHDYTLSKMIPGKEDIMYDLLSVANDEAGGDYFSLAQVKEWLAEYYQWKSTQKQSSLGKIAKIVFQNIFFSTPEEATAYQEQMKKMNPPTGDVNKGLPKIDENMPPAGDEAPLGDQDEINSPSQSYDDFEKDKAEEQKYLTKRIEREVKDQVESALEQKVATKFSKNDEELVEAMRGVGRTWEEISDYMVKNLKYAKEDVAMFLDHFKQSDSSMPTENPLLKNRPKDEAPLGDEPKIEEPKPEAPKPPAELVSPETHDKLVQEVDEIKKKDMQEIAKLDTEISKKAFEPLETRPTSPNNGGTDQSPLDGADVTDQMMEEPSEPPHTIDPEDQTDNLELKPNDQVYIMGDYDSGQEGFGGTYLSQYKSDGETYAVVDKGGNNLVEIPLRNVKKAFYTNVLNKTALRKKERDARIKAEVDAIQAELATLTKEAESMVEAAPFEQPAPVNQAPVQQQPAAPMEAPIKFKPMDRAPDNTKDQEMVNPSPELAVMLRDLNDVTAKIDEMNKAVKQFIAKIESEKQQRLKEFENKMEPEKLKALQEQLTQRIGAVAQAMQNKAIESSEYVYRLIEETKVNKYKISDKELLEKVLAKFDGAKQYVDSVINGAKSKDTKTEETTLYRSPKPKPKKSMSALSSRDIEANMIDTLSDMYQDMVNALKLLMEADDMLGASVGETAGAQ